MYFSSRIVSFFNDTATTELYTLSLHDALPICVDLRQPREHVRLARDGTAFEHLPQHRQTQRFECWQRHGRIAQVPALESLRDRKSKRLNSSHLGISYAVFCLKKKKKGG